MGLVFLRVLVLPAFLRLLYGKEYCQKGHSKRFSKAFSLVSQSNHLIGTVSGTICWRDSKFFQLTLI